MNGKKAKQLRRQVTGDPDMEGRIFVRKKVVACDIVTHEEYVDPKSMTTMILHPHSFRAQYQQAKKEIGRC